MRISKIEYENFRNFKDHGCIEFPTNGGVTVIYGPNGVGKTTLHQFFQWVFYGEVHFNKTTSKEMYNLEYEKRIGVHERFSVLGKVDFEHPNYTGGVDKYSLRREWVYTKKIASSVLNEDECSFKLYKYIGDDWKLFSNSPEMVIEQFLPSGLSQYFFFDGESMIADLNQTGKDSAKFLRKALYSILDLNIYEQAIIHIGRQDSGSSTVLGSLYASLSKGSSNSDIIKARGNYNQALDRVERLNDDIIRFKNTINGFAIEEKELSEQIGSATSKKTMEAQRKTAKNAIKTNEDNIEAYKKSFGKIVMEKYPYLFLSRVVEEAQNRIGLQVEEQKLPHGLTKELVQMLLDSDTCVCGNPITAKEKDVLKELEKMFPPLSYKYIYDQFKNSAKRWSTTYDQNALVGEIEKIFKAKRNIEELQQEIHDIDIALKQSGNVDELIAKRAEAERSKQFWTNKLMDAEKELGVKERYKKQYKENLDKLLVNNSSNKLLYDQIEVMENVRDYYAKLLSSSSKTYSEKLCVAIQLLLNEMLTGKRRVALTSQFELSVTDSHGNQAKSEGQFAIVSFAYIGGIFKLLREVPALQGKEFPLILDGPFSKLDAQHRQKVIDILPSYAPQIILFSKDDINSCFGKTGPENVLTIYSNDERNISTVKYGYDPEVFRVNGSDN